MSEKKYNKNSLQGTVYVLLSAICFSLGGVLIKSIPWNSLSINMVRSVLSFILIFAYQRTQIREQIQAVYDAGYEEWILWNATNRYSAEGLLGADEVEDNENNQ